VARIDGKTSIKIDDLVNSSVISGRVSDDGQLILKTRGGAEILAGSVTGSGTSSFDKVFAIATDLWTCQHNLGVLDPQVICYDAEGDRVFGDIRSVDLNTITVSWYMPMTGSCRITA
jgi:hypothetical protein